MYMTLKNGKETKNKIKIKIFFYIYPPINRYVKGNFQHKGLPAANPPKNQKEKFWPAKSRKISLNLC